MNPTYVRIELARQGRDIGNLMFTVGLPAVMYLLFGNMFGGGAEQAGGGNVKFYIMVSMAAYGAAVATTGIAGTAATENMLGWGRQIALTPMKPSGFIQSKMAVALTIAAAAAGAVFILGAATGAQADSNSTMEANSRTLRQWFMKMAPFTVSVLGPGWDGPCVHPDAPVRPGHERRMRHPLRR